MISARRELLLKWLYMNYKRKVIRLIIWATVLRLIFSGVAELNNDEVYYRAYARVLQWNYYDHPPMVGLLIKFSTLWLNLNHEIFIRLGAVLCAAIGSWFIYLCGSRLKDEQLGFVACILYQCSFYSSVIAGVLILPDSPQMMFWMISLYLMIRIVQEDDPPIKLFVFLGVTTALCMLSKAHGVFCWLGFGGYILFQKRELLAKPGIYIAVATSVILMLPTVTWSLLHPLGTYEFHSSRIKFERFNKDSLLREVLGSFLYQNPINTILLIITFVRRKNIFENIEWGLIYWMGFPLIATVLVLSIFNDTLPHWSGPAHATLMLITADYLCSMRPRRRLKWLRWSGGLTLGAAICALLIVNFIPLSLGKTELPAYGKNDVTLDMSGWRKFGDDFVEFHKADSSFGATSIYSSKWFPAGHLDYYVARRTGLYLRGFGTPNAIHQYYWLNQTLPEAAGGSNDYYVTISNFFEPVPNQLGALYTTIDQPVLIPQMRGGVIVRYFYVYRLRNKKRHIG